jgi:hypothetical protein
MLARSGAVFPAWRAESNGNRITESASVLKGQAKEMCLVAIHLAKRAGLVATVHASEERCCL